jgi:hypothetical protein
MRLFIWASDAGHDPPEVAHVRPSGCGFQDGKATSKHPEQRRRGEPRCMWPIAIIAIIALQADDDAPSESEVVWDSRACSGQRRAPPRPAPETGRRGTSRSLFRYGGATAPARPSASPPASASPLP